MKRKAFLIILIFFFLLDGYAKGVATRTVSPSDTSAEGYQFIFVCPILENEYWESCFEGIRKADAELGTTTRIVGPRTADHFSTEIVGYMEEAVAARPDGIMAYAGIEAMFPLIEQAAAQNIPVLALDSDAPDTSRVAYVGTDPYNAGYQAGEAMLKFTDESGKLGVMVSSLSAEKEMQVLKAFQDTIDDYDLEIVAIAETDANADMAEIKTREMLEEHPEITAIFSTASYNVTGAARVKKEQGLDDLILLGFDDVKENLQYVREGVINAILVQQIREVGYLGVYLMKECVENGDLRKENYDTGTILVTQENVDTYSDANLTLNSATERVRIGYYTGNPALQDGFSDDVRKSGYAYEYYQAIAALVGWNYDYHYGSRAEILQQLIEGKVDIVAGIHQTDIRAEQMLFSKQSMGLDGVESYFAVNSARADLLTDLDYAMEQITQFSPDFTVTLEQKYYNQTANQSFSNREIIWLASKGALRVGYVRHNLPLSEQGEDGKPTGVIKDLIKLLGNSLPIAPDAVCYETVNQLETGLRTGEIDIAFPIYSDIWLSEIKGFRQTDPFISDRVMMIYQGDYTSDLMDRVALSETGIGQRYYLSNYYPDSEVVFYESREAALEAIQRGNERCIVGCSSILQRFLGEHTEFRNLNIAYLDTSEDFSMAVSQENALLAGILNKIIRQIGVATITSEMMQYSSVSSSFTFTEMLQHYSVQVIGILCLFFAILLHMFFSHQRKAKIFNEEQEKSRIALERALYEAKLASESKTTFLSTMSHDIRTPMNAIVGMTSIASSHLDDPSRVKDCLEKISLSSHHLLTLINDVLDISKIESGNLALHPTIFSLRDAVSTLVSIARPLVRDKNLAFDIYIHDINYETICADEVRLNQIFINILTNAIKYTPDGGKIVMDLREEMLSEGHMIRLTYIVEDTGIGMSKEFMENMYDIFTRAADSRTTKIQGTGLGLAIVKRIVDMMNGHIDCQSEEGKGSKFTVSVDLPIAKEAVETPNLPNIQILLVDDDEIFLENTTEIMQDMGALVETANSGATAVEMVQARHQAGRDYTISIIDWKMPGMGGMETIQAIRAIMGKEAPIILVSAYDWSDIEEEAQASGANGFINKPLFRSYIYDKLCEILHLREELTDEEALENHAFSGMHLLVAEDNDLNWEVISELLDMYDLSAERAENGKICVEMVTASAPGTYDAILMDIQMPVMDGREATRIIRSREEESVRTIPIIAMTADAFAEDIAASMEAGMDGHVSKPVNMDLLFQELQRVLPGRTQEHTP